MDAIKFPQVDCVAVAPGCFDLPQAQCITVCPNCERGKMPNNEDCAKCDGNGYLGVRLITCWQLSQEELEIVKKTGKIWLHICAAQTPPVLVDVNEPFETWSDIVPLKKFIKDANG